MLSWNRRVLQSLGYLIPWPGPQVMFVALTFFDPLSIEMQSSPSKITDNVRDYNPDLGWRIRVLIRYLDFFFLFFFGGGGGGVEFQEILPY